MTWGSDGPKMGSRRTAGLGGRPAAVHANTNKRTALDISCHLCLHTLCSLADKTAEGTVLRLKGDEQTQRA